MSSSSSNNNNNNTSPPPKPINLAAYSKSMLTTPFFHFIAEPWPPVFHQMLSAIYFLRWQLARPFQVRILPKWWPRIPLPGLSQIVHLTYGELLLALPLFALVVTGYYFIFHTPDVELSGDISSYAIIIGFLTANKSSSIFSFVLGIPFERLLGYHKLSAVVGLTIAIAHVNLAYEAEGEGHSLGAFAIKDLNNTLGTVIFVCLSGLLMSSFFPCLRRMNYDLWFFIHMTLAVSIALPWACHSVNWVWLPLFWFVLDVSVRYVLMTGCRYASTATLRKLHQLDVIEVRFPKPAGFHYNPGQYVRIAVPKITAFQFHPFSVSSAPHEDYVTLHIRAVGNWSKKLLHLAKTKEGNDGIKIWLEGPYGSISVDLDHPRYGMVLCVCGGIGMTFGRSVIRSMLHDVNRTPLDQLRMVWATKDQRMVDGITPFRQEPRDGGNCPLLHPTWVRADVFVTNLNKKLDDDDAAPVDEESFSDVDIDVEDEQQDPQQQQQQHMTHTTHRGRPNLDAIVTEMKEEAIKKGVTHIAVLGCGPRGLIETLQEVCRKKSKGMMDCRPGVYIDVHSEVFEF